jgi:hypothetical protein
MYNVSIYFNNSIVVTLYTVETWFVSGENCVYPVLRRLIIIIIIIIKILEKCTQEESGLCNVCSELFVGSGNSG